ncbi:four-helix bundle copper-binding protein [Jiella marina]|uniref:four-helix bundle copper-binding protein n=1 Tax=Jiella sp. LLJ827 TaxID=2917712 RepID=UPI0021017AE8|nr:four-helix bundle copper-binding protein [Jiella sp. LLJ827]MCQ0987422.1 four-helix bundle copper-binding protein [Jiella sp. LLJ827]
MSIHEMISTHPHVAGHTNDPLTKAIAACYECAETCTSCADACLGEKPDMLPNLTQCIRLNSDCADICNAAGRIATRRTGSNEALIKSVLAACAEAAQRCGDECGKHAEMHEHCRICAEACRRCVAACNEAVGTISA